MYFDVNVKESDIDFSTLAESLTEFFLDKMCHKDTEKEQESHKDTFKVKDIHKLGKK